MLLRPSSCCILQHQQHRNKKINNPVIRRRRRRRSPLGTSSFSLSSPSPRHHDHAHNPASPHEHATKPPTTQLSLPLVPNRMRHGVPFSFLTMTLLFVLIVAAVSASSSAAAAAAAGTPHLNNNYDNCYRNHGPAAAAATDLFGCFNFRRRRTGRRYNSKISDSCDFLATGAPSAVAASAGKKNRRQTRRQRQLLLKDEYQGEADSAAASVALFQSSSSTSQSSMWPPWPFNLLARPFQRGGRDRRDDRYGDGERGRTGTPAVSYTNSWSLFGRFAKQSTKAGFRRLQYMSSQLLFHLPPAAHPLFLVAAIPQRRKIVTDAMAEEIAYETVIPLFTNSFVRNLALSTLGLALLSWGHYQVHRKRMLTRLPLGAPYRDLNFAVLPPFLPEEVEISDPDDLAWMVGQRKPSLDDGEDEDEVVQIESSSATSSPRAEDDDDEEDVISGKLPRRLRGHWRAFWGSAVVSSTYQGVNSLTPWQSPWNEWRQIRRSRKRDRHNARRLALIEELTALQALKQNAEKQRLRRSKKWGSGRLNKRNNGNNGSTDKSSEEGVLPLGYALVTGASRGIGRALAVELARWEVPLVLVARDLERLTDLAYDLKACYGVRCCVLEADLCQPGAAERIYKAVTQAGIHVDILVNNAGVSSQGVSFDLPLQKVNNMLRLNVEAVSTLTHLFGRDMKERRRGRILMVSSVCGAVAGISSVAVYSATKAFEKTLALSLAKEMEPYGIGVTCLLPGAVKGTEFRSRSNSEQALCWKVPFYPLSPQQVAHVGIRSMLRGETEVTPGWMNRFFLKVVQPALPQRVHTIVAGVMWNPIRFPSFFGRRSRGWEARASSTTAEPTASSLASAEKHNVAAPPPKPSSMMGLHHGQQQKFEEPPRLLMLEDVAPSPKSGSSLDENKSTAPASSDDADHEGTVVADEAQDERNSPPRVKIEKPILPELKKNATMGTTSSTVDEEDNANAHHDVGNDTGKKEETSTSTSTSSSIANHGEKASPSSLEEEHKALSAQHPVAAN